MNTKKEKLNSLLSKETFSSLLLEESIFNRILYKHKNQHRRTLYWRKLIRVRSVLKKLLPSLQRELCPSLSRFFDKPSFQVDSKLKAFCEVIERYCKALRNAIEDCKSCSRFLFDMIQSSFFLSMSCCLVASVSRIFAFFRALLELLCSLFREIASQSVSHSTLLGASVGGARRWMVLSLDFEEELTTATALQPSRERSEREDWDQRRRQQEEKGEEEGEEEEEREQKKDESGEGESLEEAKEEEAKEKEAKEKEVEGEEEEEEEEEEEVNNIEKEIGNFSKKHEKSRPESMQSEGERKETGKADNIAKGSMGKTKNESEEGKHSKRGKDSKENNESTKLKAISTDSSVQDSKTPKSLLNKVTNSDSLNSTFSLLLKDKTMEKKAEKTNIKRKKSEKTTQEEGDEELNSLFAMLKNKKAKKSKKSETEKTLKLS